LRESIVPRLVCPATGQPLTLKVFERDGDEVVEGLLTSEAGTSYSVTRGIPRMMVDRNSGVVERTVENFGWQWRHFRYLLEPPLENLQFLDWIWPLTENDFKGKVVLDAGCGMGRWPETVARFGASEVFAVDLGSAVEAAYERLRGYPHVHVIQADILALPFRQGAEAPFDIAYSLGVIHHMPEAHLGFRAYSRHVKPGGKVHAWVYGAENNGWISNWVNPIRERVTSHLPPPALHEISRGLTLPIHIASRAVHATGLKGLFVYGEYLDWLGRFPFVHTHHIVHDHLTPSLASYHSRDEVEQWAKDAGLVTVTISSRNRNSWRLVGRMP
jgi:SAM-dependent methyltransferase